MPEIANIDPDTTCPECGEPAEFHGTIDMRDQGGKKFKQYNHKRSDGAFEIVQEWCAEIIAE